MAADDRNGQKIVKPATIETRDRQIRACGSALIHGGRDPASIGTLADLVDVAAFRQVLRYFIDRNGGQSSGWIADLAATLKAIARHWVKVAPNHLDQLSAVQRRIAQHGGGGQPLYLYGRKLSRQLL
jgi:hypothetical protein